MKRKIFSAFRAQTVGRSEELNRKVKMKKLLEKEEKMKKQMEQEIVKVS